MRRLATLALLTACSGAPERNPNAPPDLLVVFLPVDSGATEPPSYFSAKVSVFTDAHGVHTHPGPSLRAALTGQWPGTVSTTRPNTLHSVLRLYGYRTVGSIGHDWNGTDFKLDDGLEPIPDAPCLADQIEAFRRLHPKANDVALAGILAPSGRGCGADGGRSSGLAALSDFLASDRAAHTVTAVVGLHAPLIYESAIPFWMAGPGVPTTPTSGLVSAVDLLPTLLPEAKAVVPSDATGTDLHTVFEKGPDAASVAVFQQDNSGTLVVRTHEHLLIVPDVDGPLPEAPPAGVTTRSVGHSPPTHDQTRALYAALVQWDRQRRATSAAERMGNGAFREMLRDQGYWH